MSGLFPDAIDIIRVQPEDMLKELDREIALRRNKYPEWAQGGRLDAGIAKMQLARLMACRNVIHNLIIGRNAGEQKIEPRLDIEEA